MNASHTVHGSEQVKAMTHPLRQRILELMIEAPITTKQAAERLGEKPTKLYHHVETLESAGLIKLVRTQRKRGTVEKYFEAVAECFVMDRETVGVRPPLDADQGELGALIAGSLEDTLEEIRFALASGLVQADGDSDESVFIRSHLRMAPEKIEVFLERLQAWIEECQVSHDPGEETEYGLTVAFYPTKNPR